MGEEQAGEREAASWRPPGLPPDSAWATALSRKSEEGTPGVGWTWKASCPSLTSQEAAAHSIEVSDFLGGSAGVGRLGKHKPSPAWAPRWGSLRGRASHRLVHLENLLSFPWGFKFAVIHLRALRNPVTKKPVALFCYQNFWAIWSMLSSLLFYQPSYQHRRQKAC